MLEQVNPIDKHLLVFVPLKMFHLTSTNRKMSADLFFDLNDSRNFIS